MPVHGGPDIITNGLVLSLDAGDRNSYTSGSTSWFDLSGNNNTGTLTNGPTFNTGSLGSIVFDGVDDFVTGSLSTLTDFTITYTVNSNNISSALIYYPLGLNFSGSSNGGGVYFGGTFTSLTTGLYDGSNTVSSSISVAANTWYIITATRSSNVGSIYINGILRGTSTVFTSSILNYTIAKRTDNFWPYNGRIASTQIYNRALTSDEILQNYNATRTRFGL